MTDSLTTKTYWENYYSQTPVSQDQILKICGHYDSFWDQMVASCNQPPKTIIEIGAYPGRYIAYLASRYNLEATALDYNSDRSRIEEAFIAMNVSRFAIVQADFLHYKSAKQFDLVISNGFIEHFENYKEVLDLHAKYLAPGGAMFIMIPNKRYFRKWYGKLVDNENLKAHNLKCMTLKTFQNFASRNNLNIEFLDYYGGFAFRVHQSLTLLQKLIYKPIRWLSLVFEQKLASRPNRWWSGTIVCILSKH